MRAIAPIGTVLLMMVLLAGCAPSPNPYGETLDGVPGEAPGEMAGEGRGGVTGEMAGDVLGREPGDEPAVEASGEPKDEDRAGFWKGLWHGFIVFFTVVISIFSDKVGIYEVNNSGTWYHIGYLLGIMIFFGGSGRGSSHKKK